MTKRSSKTMREKATRQLIGDLLPKIGAQVKKSTGTRACFTVYAHPSIINPRYLQFAIETPAKGGESPFVDINLAFVQTDLDAKIAKWTDGDYTIVADRRRTKSIVLARTHVKPRMLKI